MNTVILNFGDYVALTILAVGTLTLLALPLLVELAHTPQMAARVDYAHYAVACDAEANAHYGERYTRLDEFVTFVYALFTGK